MVSVIVVTWNSEKHLLSCLNSVKEQKEIEVELVVVDNNSVDKTKEIIRPFNPEVIIENNENLGYAKANNQGIAKAGGEYVLTLNPDVILDQDFLKNARESMDVNDRTGMISGRLSRPSGRIDSQGVYLSRVRRFFDLGEGRNPGRYPLIGPCAAAGLYRRKMLDEIKIGEEYFDEDFFAYVEDVDLAWRANDFNWKAVYCKSALAIHHRGGSGIDPDWKQYLSFRNRYLMMIKNEKCSHYLKNILFYLSYDIPRFFYIALTNRYFFIKFKEFLGLISKAWEKRELIESYRKYK